MKSLAAVLLLAAGAVQAAPMPSTLRACVKWSREIPEAKAAGIPLFATVERVEGAGPYLHCDAVTVTESFGVGWLMRAWMKQGVFTACGERLGGYKINYKGDAWQAKVVVGLHKFLDKNAEALAKIKACVPPPVVTPAPAVTPPPQPVAESPAPVVQPAAVPATLPSSTTPSAPVPEPQDSISQPAVAPVHTSQELSPK